MGLDMHLTGERYLIGRGRRTRGGAKSVRYDLGYWRKHPNLHGYIVGHFAGGVDECQEIDLSVEQIGQVIAAIKARELPETTGFFFGESEETDERIAHDVRIFEGALEWLRASDPSAWRSVTYQASW